MKELYIEDLANHGGPEPCVGVPRGRSEALDRGARRPAIEPRKANVWGADAVTSGVFASRQWTPRGRRTRACVRSLHVREPGEPILTRGLID